MRTGRFNHAIQVEGTNLGQVTDTGSWDVGLFFVVIVIVI